MKRTLAILSQHPELLEMCKSVEAIKKRHGERVAFLQKQADDDMEQCKTEAKILLNNIEEYLKTRGMLTTIDRENQHVCWNTSEDAINLHTDDHDDENPLSRLIAMMEERENGRHPEKN